MFIFQSKPNITPALQDDASSKKQKKKKARPEKPRREPQNSAVYVSNIPLDADTEEIHYVFKKCGMIAENVDSEKPRIKMYEDESGNFKGDALIVYFQPHSVGLAIQMLDDAEFRPSVNGPTPRMSVVEADYSYKKQKLDLESTAEKEGAEKAAKPGKKGKKAPRSKDEQKFKKKAEKMKQ